MDIFHQLKTVCQRCDGSGRQSSGRRCWECFGYGHIDETTLGRQHAHLSTRRRAALESAQAEKDGK